MNLDWMQDWTAWDGAYDGAYSLEVDGSTWTACTNGLVAIAVAADIGAAPLDGERAERWRQTIFHMEDGVHEVKLADLKAWAGPADWSRMDPPERGVVFGAPVNPGLLAIALEHLHAEIVLVSTGVQNGGAAIWLDAAHAGPRWRAIVMGHRVDDAELWNDVPNFGDQPLSLGLETVTL